MKPINKQVIEQPAQGCFGVEYDNRASECKRCADNLLCMTRFQQNVIKSQAGRKYMGDSTLDTVSYDYCIEYIRVNEPTVGEMIDHIMELTNHPSKEDVTDWLVSFKKVNPQIKIKNQIFKCC